MRSLSFFSFLLSGTFYAGCAVPVVAWAMDDAEEAILRDSAKNDKEGEQDAYRRQFNRQEEERVAEAEKRYKAHDTHGKKVSDVKLPSDVDAYLSAHKGAKTALTPPPAIEGEDGAALPLPELSPEEAKAAERSELNAQLHARQQTHRQNAAMTASEKKGFLLGMDPQQKVSSRYFSPSGFASANQNAVSSYGGNLKNSPLEGTESKKWQSQLPGLTVDELAGETQGSLIDALELCPPSAQPEHRLDVCLKHHSPPEWWLADLKRSSPKLLVEKWKMLKTIKVKNPADPLVTYAGWLADMIPKEFTDRHHPEFIEALRKPQPVAKAEESASKVASSQKVSPPPLNLAEARAAFAGGLQKPQSIPSLEEEKNRLHQRQERLAENKTESYIGDDNAQYLYPVTNETRSYQPGELRPPRPRHLTAPPAAGVEAYRDE